MELFAFNNSKQTNTRKSGINNNKEGSVRKVNGKIYVDFTYLNNRVRESSGLPWNKENAKLVRKQLDKIIIAIKEGSFTFASVFPKSKKVDYFSDQEHLLLRRNIGPERLLFTDYVWEWYKVHKESGRVTERTLLSYKDQIRLYLLPYFGDYSFKELNAARIEDFVAWARKQKFRQKSVSNKSINKYLVPMRMICAHAAIKFDWGATYNPFFGFKKLREERTSGKIMPFSIAEQTTIITTLSEHWKPYFQFAFCSGLRQGEQIALRVQDIDWDKNVIHIRRANTLDENGGKVVGRTKNRYSRRTLNLLPLMREALLIQEKTAIKLNSNYLFCTKNGQQINPNNLRNRVWVKALKKASIPYRPMIQTRHTFATTALSLGENPLWIAKVMGHRDTEMIIKVYAKYVENISETSDGKALSDVYAHMIGSHN